MGERTLGSNIKRIPEATVEEMEEACSADPGCAGFNTMGWMKAAIDPEDKWYAAEGDFSETGQSQATDAVSMLGFILEETKKEETQAHTDEEASQHTFEDTMSDLKTH